MDWDNLSANDLRVVCAEGSSIEIHEKDREKFLAGEEIKARIIVDIWVTKAED